MTPFEVMWWTAWTERLHGHNGATTVEWIDP
jgi:hypothetical protein